jgi:hypothetical protein
MSHITLYSFINIIECESVIIALVMGVVVIGTIGLVVTLKTTLTHVNMSY